MAMPPPSLNRVPAMPNNRETVAIVHEAMEAVNRIVTHLSLPGFLVGAGRPPRGAAEVPMVEYQFARVAFWMRCFADELPKFDRATGRTTGEIKAMKQAVSAMNEAVSAVTKAVVVGQFHADPERFKTLSATADAVHLIMDARATGYSLLKYVARIVGSDTRDIYYHPDTLRDHAAKLEAMEIDEKLRSYDVLLFELRRQREGAKPLNARWRELHLPLQVELLRIGGLSEATKPTTAPSDGQQAYEMQLADISLTWREIARSIDGESFDQMARADQENEIDRIERAARRYATKIGVPIPKKSSGRTQRKK